MNVPLFAALGASDVADAVALWQAAGLTRPWNDPATDFLRAISAPASVVLGWREEGALIATVMVGHDGHRGWLYYLAVVEPRRGAGIGRAIVAAAEAWLAQRDVPKVQLMIRRDNVAARRFYEALSYTDSDVTVVAKWLDRA